MSREDKEWFDQLIAEVKRQHLRTPEQVKKYQERNIDYYLQYTHNVPLSPSYPCDTCIHFCHDLLVDSTCIQVNDTNSIMVSTTSTSSVVVVPLVSSPLPLLPPPLKHEPFDIKEICNTKCLNKFLQYTPKQNHNIIRLLIQAEWFEVLPLALGEPLKQPYTLLNYAFHDICLYNKEKYMHEFIAKHAQRMYGPNDWDNDDSSMCTEEWIYGVCWKNGLKGTCKGGHFHLVPLMIERGACNYHRGLAYAVQYKKQEWIDYFLKFNIQIFDTALYKACKNGDLNMLQFLIQECTKKTLTFSTSNLMHACCKHNQLHLIHYLETIKTIKPKAWAVGFNVASRYNRSDILLYLSNRPGICYSDALVEACKGGHMNLIVDYIDKAKQDLDYALAIFHSFFHSTAQVQFLLDHYYKNTYIAKEPVNFNWLLYKACVHDMPKHVDLMVSLGATDFNFALRGAFENHNPRMMKKMLDLGADPTSIEPEMIKRAADDECH
jgi:hypothetical protein